MVQTDTFQHYQILRREDGSLWELGRGAMGVTYKALDTNLRSPVALKVVNGLNLADGAARARFLREARAAAALRHRNVASVYHLCEDGEHFFYAMEFVDGETVEELVRRIGPLPVATALNIVLQATRALGAAARQRLVHRDVKPANLMVTREDEDEGFVVKLIDFGLARSFRGGGGGDSSAASASASSAGGGFRGTPAFASPEQLNEEELDVRSDIYALGATLWFMLAGEPPFSGTLATLYRQVLQQPPPWERLPAGLPEPVLNLLLRPMLEKHPDRRPQGATALRDRVLECLRAIFPSSAPGVPGMEGEEMGLGSPELSPADAGGNLPEPEPGLRLADGLELGSRVGESNRGQVFRATDPRREGQAVAVKVFHPETLNDARFQALRERAGRLRDAPHPNLIRVYAVERYQHHTYAELEWVEGFTLMNLLRRRGTLTVVECLCLLQQVAAVADHVRAHGLTDLGLAPHQVLVEFPGGPRVSRPGVEALMHDPVTEWPEFVLKLDALGSASAGDGDSTTWLGKISVAPGPVPAPGLAGPVPNHGPDLRAIGILVYELLGGSGAPPLLRIGQGAAAAGGEEDSRPPTLLILGAVGNAVLRQCLSGEGSFQSEGEFFDALVRATGHHPGSLRPAGPGPTAGPSPAWSVPSLPANGSTTIRTRPEERTVSAPGELVPLAKAGAKPWQRMVAALPAGSPRRRHWAMALVGLALLLVLANVAWWLLGMEEEEPSRVTTPEAPVVPRVEAAPPAASAPPPEGPVPTPPVVAEPTPAMPLAPAEPPAPPPAPIAPSLVPPEVPAEPSGPVKDAAAGPVDQPGALPAPAVMAPKAQPPAAPETGNRPNPSRFRSGPGGAFSAVESPTAAGRTPRSVQPEGPRDWEELSPRQRRALRRRRFDPDFLERTYGVRPPATKEAPARSGER